MLNQELGEVVRSRVLFGMIGFWEKTVANP